MLKTGFCVSEIVGIGEGHVIAILHLMPMDDSHFCMILGVFC